MSPDSAGSRVTLEGLVRGALVLMVGAMLAVILASVFARFVLAEPLTWGEEATRFLLVWTTFLGAGLATKHGKELAARELALLLPARALRALDGLVLLASLGFLGVLVWAGVVMLPVGHQNVSEILQVPYSLVYLAVPAGGGLMAFYLALRLRDLWRGRALREDPAPR